MIIQQYTDDSQIVTEYQLIFWISKENILSYLNHDNRIPCIKIISDLQLDNSLISFRSDNDYIPS